jgi:hypothetical protein
MGEKPAADLPCSRTSSRTRDMRDHSAAIATRSSHSQWLLILCYVKSHLSAHEDFARWTVRSEHLVSWHIATDVGLKLGASEYEDRER